MSDFSKTAMKRIRRMSKNELVTMVVQLSNYAEHQKAENIYLLNALKAANNLEAVKTEEEPKTEDIKENAE